MRNKIEIGLVTMTMILTSIVFVPSQVEAGSVANVLVYTGRGSWDDGITAFENFCDWKGLSYYECDDRYIETNSLVGKFDVIYFPGGNAYQYNRWINSDGKENIRDFVSSGGGYLGICAGGYFACDYIIWEGDYEYYTLDLFDGYGVGALDPIIPWDDYTMTWTTMNSDNPLNYYEPSQQYQMYYGGAAFYPAQGQECNVIATYDSYYDEPAMINFGYGSGHVVLYGPHPEIEEDDTRDGTDFGDELSDLGTDWTILWTSMDYLMDVPISQPPGVEPPDDEAPVIAWVSDNPDPCDAGVDLVFQAEVTDNEEVDQVWVTIDGEDNYMTYIGNDVYQYTMGTAGMYAGEYPYTVYADDPSDNQATPVGGTFNIIGLVPDTEPPVIQWVSDSPDPCQGGNDVTFQAEVTDNEAVDDVWINVLGEDQVMTNIGGDIWEYVMETGSTSQGIFFLDDFESGFTWTTYGEGTPWGLGTGGNPGSCAHVKKTGAGKYSYFEKIFDTTDATGLTLKYDRKLKGFDAADDWGCQYDSGSGWVYLEHQGSENGGFVHKEFALPGSCENNPNLKIRFFAECGAVSEEAWCDNIEITATMDSTMEPGAYPYTVYADDPAGNDATPVGGTFNII